MVERPSRWPVFQGWSNGVINLDFFFFYVFFFVAWPFIVIVVTTSPFPFVRRCHFGAVCSERSYNVLRFLSTFFSRLISLNWYYYVEIGISRRKRWSVTINLTIDIGYNFNQTKQTCSTWLVTTIMSNKIVRNFIESLHIFFSLQSGDWMERKHDTFYCGFYFKP